MEEVTKKREALVKLREEMKGASLPLKQGATNLVFGEGNPNAQILFIGEGPGFYEDKQARPFVGRAGAFLNQLLQLIEVERKSVFITNVVHYRPPENRDPSPEEMAAFAPYIDKMIEIIEPKAIVTLGRFSMGKFLPGVTITTVHGKERVVNWRGKDILIFPMYHPAAALRSSEIKRRSIEDFKKLPKILEDFAGKMEKAKEQAKLAEMEQMELV